MAERKFGNRTFKVGIVLATDAIRLQARLLRVIGSGMDRLPAILASRREGASEAERTAGDAAAVAALSDVFAKIDADEMTALLGDIIGYAQIKQSSGSYGQADLDQDFTEHKGDIFPVALFVLKEVLGDFFSGALASGALQKAGRA